MRDAPYIPDVLGYKELDVVVVGLCVMNSPYRMPVRTFWKEHQRTFPARAKLARDVLSISATGAGVERLFNSARNICHYRRGFLNADTIQGRMLYKCTTKFKIEEETITLRRECLATEEVEINQEERYTQLMVVLSQLVMMKNILMEKKTSLRM